MTYEEMVAMPLHSISCVRVMPFQGTQTQTSAYLLRVPGGWIYWMGTGSSGEPKVFVPEASITKVKLQSEGINLTENL